MSVEILGNTASIDSPAETYHENSKAFRLPGGDGLSTEVMEAMSHGYKVYADSPTVALPIPVEVTTPLSLAIRDRQSHRTYAEAPVPLELFSCLLFSAYGQRSPSEPFRTVPSGGGLYPLELYLVILAHDELDPGVYHYDVRSHQLEQVPYHGSPRRICDAIFVAETARTATSFLVVSAIFGRGRIKYGERAYRFALLEAGHVLQNVALVSNALGLGCCPFGGFVDDEVNDLLCLDGVDEAAIYLASIGTLEPTKRTEATPTEETRRSSRVAGGNRTPRLPQNRA